MTGSGAGSTRIGNEERDSAMQALAAHMDAGRLDPEEYGERVARVSVARTAADLDPLFVDLPAPHPVAGTAARAQAVAQGRGPAAPAPRRPARRPDRRGRDALGGRVGETIVAISPIIAVVLFFIIPFDNAWVFFLLIPVAGAIVYGRNWRGE